jgi:enoyl-CoA hydratase/long-chain 3-hydroxyacyl-CoA dehydrogenase
LGIDVANHVSLFMIKCGDLGERLIGQPDVMNNLVKAGAIGKKAEKGFYAHPKDAKKGDKKVPSAEFVKVINEFTGGKTAKVAVEDIQGRLVSRYVNETAYCLQDGIVRGPADGDIGSVFGIGFSPFLGGPFKMLDIQGTKQFVDRMYRYRDQYGPQFEPAQILKDYAASGKKFHK